MTQMFDPNIPNFAAQNEAAARQRALADLLRKQSMSTQAPQGQMVSGHYVAPHWSQHLGGIMDKINAGWQDRIAGGAERDALNQQNQAANEWRSGLPQGTSAQAGTPSYGANEMDNEAVTGSPAVPYQPVPAATRLKHTLAGLANPLTAKEALLWNQGMGEEATREDNQQARRESLAATLEAKREDALRRSEDARLTREQQLQARREALAMQEQLARMHDTTRRELAAQSDATRRDLAATVRGVNGDPVQVRLDKQLPMLAERVKDINPLISAGNSLQNLFDTYGDKGIPGFGYAGKLPGIALSAEGNRNRAALKSFTNAIMRANAGLSQTLAEQHNVNLETLADGNYSEKEIRKVWPLLREKANDALTGITAGFAPDVVDIYGKRGGLVKPITPKAPKALGAWKIEEAK